MELGEVASLEFTVKALKTGEITNTATVSAAETDPDLTNNTATNTVNLTSLTIPNVFTPNGDGVNETFEIPGLETFTANDITIVNRWGATVYQKKGYKNEWDGQGLNEGTYFYILKVETSNGKWDIYKGYITLLRNKK
jgi:gliding motility-associated-like protein